MNTKSIFLSKTFWVQVVTVVSLAFPQVRTWLEANPVEFVAVLAALNLLVRFATSGKISIFGAGEPDDDKSGGLGGLPLWIVLGTAACLGGLPSCSAIPVGTPVKFSLIAPDGAVSYSAKGGLEVSAIVRGEK